MIELLFLKKPIIKVNDPFRFDLEKPTLIGEFINLVYGLVLPLYLCLCGLVPSTVVTPLNS